MNSWNRQNSCRGIKLARDSVEEIPIKTQTHLKKSSKVTSMSQQEQQLNKSNIQLVCIRFSPWSLRARWALGHHGIPYSYTEYTPKLSEPWLRYKMGKWSGQITVPVMFVEQQQVLADSVDIAKFADHHNSTSVAPKLFPSEHEAEIEKWIQTSDAILDPLRITGMMRSAQSEELQQEVLPSWAKTFGFVSRCVYSSAVGYIVNKYANEQDGRTANTIEGNQKIATRHLDEVREHLKEGNRQYMVGDQFTFADITIAAALQLLKPMDDQYLKLSKASRLAATDPLEEQYQDLIAWRDNLLAKHFQMQGEEK